jgi:hypothetical protein
MGRHRTRYPFARYRIGFRAATGRGITLFRHHTSPQRYAPEGCPRGILDTLSVVSDPEPSFVHPRSKMRHRRPSLFEAIGGRAF